MISAQPITLQIIIRSTMHAGESASQTGERNTAKVVELIIVLWFFFNVWCKDNSEYV